MKKILVLGTGAPQADLMRACRERGLEVWACSYRSGDPGEKEADHFAQINLVDADAVKAFVQANGIDLVSSAGSDVAMPTAFTVSEQLGLPAYCPARTAVICNTKSLMRETFGGDYAWNIPYQTMESADDEIRISFPLIMKPVDSQGQRGVFMVKDREELLAHFEESMSHSREKKLILEKFVKGEEISVNTFTVNGKIVFSLPSERIVWEGFTGGLIHRHLLPGKWAAKPEVTEEVQKLVKATLEKLQLKNGPAYFQIMIESGTEKPYLIEVTPRLDGCHMWRLIRFSTGVDLMAMTVDGLLGKLTDETLSYDVAPYETEFLCSPPGKAFDRAAYGTEGAEYLEWYYQTGDTVRRMNGYMEKCGYVIRKM